MAAAGRTLIRFTGPEARPGAETTFAIHAAGAHDAATMPVRDDLAAAMQGFETVVFDLEAAVAAVVTASATTIRLEAGFDHSLDLSAAAHRNLVTFGAGHNTVRIAGAENSVQTGDGHDTSHLAETARATDLTTGAGADRVVLEAGATGQTGLDAVIDLGAGDDTLVTNSEGALHTDLTLFGGAGDDTLTLTNVERVTAFGGEGQDSVTVVGEWDTYRQIVIDDPGSARVPAAPYEFGTFLAGFETISIDTDLGALVQLYASNVGQLNGSAQDDWINIQEGATGNVVSTFAGDDQIFDGGGGNSFDTGTGNDMFVLQSPGANMIVSMGSGSDQFGNVGSAAASGDVNWCIDMGADDDFVRLYAMSGASGVSITGGAGADEFVFSGDGDVYAITDFEKDVDSLRMRLDGATLTASDLDLEQVGDDLHLLADVDDVSMTVILENRNAADFTADDFGFF